MKVFFSFVSPQESIMVEEVIEILIEEIVKCLKRLSCPSYVEIHFDHTSNKKIKVYIKEFNHWPDSIFNENAKKTAGYKWQIYNIDGMSSVNYVAYLSLRISNYLKISNLSQFINNLVKVNYIEVKRHRISENNSYLMIKILKT